VVKSLLK